MREIALFVEDDAHRLFVGALVERIAQKRGIGIRLDWRNATGGHGKVAQEFARYARDLERQASRPPDLIVVATDANCSGPNERAREFNGDIVPAPLVRAIPDPHVERWLLLDGAAFRRVFGQGCDAPDRKCDRGRYKHLLVEAIRAAGIAPSLGGVEFAEDVAREMDLARAARADRSFKRFVDALDGVFRGWGRP